MRTFLTFVAVALVTAFTVALVAPPLIDWSARRDMVARAVSLRIGEPVAIAGPISLRLLPTPYLELADVEIGPREAPFLKGPAMRFELGLFSLFGGNLRLDDVLFERPTLRLKAPFAPPGEAPLQFEHIRAHGADIRIERADATPIVLRDLDFEGSAASTRGPFRGAGEFAQGPNRARFQFAAEAFRGDSLPLRAEIEAGATRAGFDGQLEWSGALALEGKASVAGRTDAEVWPWRIEGVLHASDDTAKLDEARVSLGPDARALQASGTLALSFGDMPALDADLKAKTLNFDSLLRRDKETFVPPSRAVDEVSALLGGALPAAVSLKLEAASAYLGARSLETPRLTLSAAPKRPLQLSLHSGLPGRATLALDGEWERGAAPILRGQASLQVGDFAPLAAWASEGDPALAAQWAALQAVLPSGPIAAVCEIEASKEGVSARKLKLDLSTSHLEGDAIYRGPSAERRGSLFLDLTADSLDIDAAPNVAAGLDGLGEADLDLRLNARSLRVARVGLASVQSGSLALSMKKVGAKVSLEKFELADLGGATIHAEGETSPAGRWARVKLDAGRLHDFASLLARTAPGGWTRWLLARADELGAARATIEARRDGPPLQGPFGLDFLKSDGDIAGARFALALTRAPAPVDAVSASATLDAPDAGALLRKLGVAIPAGPPGRAEISLSGNGRWDANFAGKARLALAGAVFEWKGGLDFSVGKLAGPLTLKSADLMPALATFGLATPGTGLAAPADMAADFEATADGGKLGKLAGSLAGAKVKGDLEFDAPTRKALSLEEIVALAKADTPPAPSPPAIRGALEFDRAAAPALLALTLGRAGPTRPGALWSESHFAAPLLTPPAADIGLKIGALDIGGLSAKGLSGRMRLDRDRLALDNVAMYLNGGFVSGRMELRRDRTLAALAGALKLEGVLLDKPAMRSKLDATLEFAGAGASPAALIAGLAGSGRAAIAEARLARHDPDALARAMARIEQAAAVAPPEGAVLTKDIGAELDRGAINWARAETLLALSSGLLRFGPIEAPAREGSATVSGAFDLSDFTLAAETTLIDDKTGPFWSGPPPTIEVAAKGPLEGLVRKIDVSLLSAGLASEAIARESERISNFEADVRERAAFNRKLKAARFIARREAEIAAYEAEQERLQWMQRYLAPYSAWAASRAEP